MKKSDIRKYALYLAIKEIQGKIDYQTNPNDKEKIEKTIAELTKQLNLYQSEVDDIKDKSYWWSIPYNIDGSHSLLKRGIFQNGFFTILDPLNEYSGTTLVKKKESMEISDFLYFRNSTNDFCDIYVDRKFLKEHLDTNVEMKVLYYCSSSYMESEPNIYTGEIPFDAENSYEYQAINKELKNRIDNFDSEMNQFESNYDSFERLMNTFASGYSLTNREQTIFGMRNFEDFIRSEFYRDYERDKYESERLSEIGQLQNKIRKIQRKAQDVQGQYDKYLLNKARGIIRGDFCTKVKECAYVYYQEDHLVAISLPGHTSSVAHVFTIFHDKEFDSINMEGKISKISKDIYSGVDICKTMEFVVNEFSSEMKPINMLSKKPKTCSDEAWRYWVELRVLKLIA